MLATTIDDVVARLDEILRDSVETGDRRGFFAALYNRVTQRVRAGILAGEFQDGPRMERLDVIFASRYLDAYDRYQRGEAPTAAWAKAFDAAKRGDLLVIEHLLLGMNAHIMLDLGIAAAEVAPGPAIEGLRADFDRINDVLASLVKTVENEIVDAAGRWEAPIGAVLHVAEVIAHGEERKTADWLMDGARAIAWTFANHLAALTGEERERAISKRDEEATLLADTVLLTRPIVELLPGANRDVRVDIRILAAGEHWR